LWSIAMQGGGCFGGFVYNEAQVGDKAKVVMKVLGRLLGDIMEVLEVLGC
ncbi:hypothetical protein Tco_1498347, partial [Tanacetum coccineum]